MTNEENKTLEKHLIKQIKRSGYPLEIETSEILESRHFVVFNSEYYFDEEAQKGRDLDIYALPLEPDPLNDAILPFRLRFELAIECKKSDAYAWVFYTRPRLPMSSVYVGGQLTTTFPKRKKWSEDSADWFFDRECLKLHYDRFDRIAIAYDELKKDKANEKAGSHRNEIFEATNQLVKFVNYLNHRTGKLVSELPAETPYREVIMILFPVIVFDGDMFEVFFKGNEPMLWKTKHILLSTHRYCPYCKESKSFTIDIVHRSYIEEFTDLLITYFVKMNEIFLEKRDDLKSRISNDRAIVEMEEKA
jgi:hypothetical protein